MHNVGVAKKYGLWYNKNRNFNNRNTVMKKTTRSVKTQKSAYSNTKLKGNAQTLRKQMTKEERKLWYDFLRDLPVRFNRQKPIGSYVVDFYSYQAQLVVELDGSQHYDSEQSILYDKKRDAYLESLGLTVMRFTNRDIRQRFDSVCEHIYRFLQDNGSVS